MSINKVQIGSILSVIIYIPIFLFGYDYIGDAVLPLALIPSVVIAWFYGVSASIAIALSMVIINWTLFYLLGDHGSFYEPMSIVGHLILIIISVLTGKFRHINNQLIESISARDALTRDFMLREELYRALFESAGDAVFLIEPARDGPPIFRECNEATVVFFGCQSKEDIIGKSPIDFSPQIQPNGRLSAEMIAEIAQQVKPGHPQVFEWQHQLEDDVFVWGEVSLSLIHVADKMYMQAIVRNIEERKKAESEKQQNEEKIRQSQKMEAIGVLTGGIAHEFNNLLVPILGYSELMLKHAASTDDKQMISNIQTAALRSKKLVQQMLAYGRYSVSQFQQVDLTLLIQETVTFLSKTLPENVTIRCDINPVPTLKVMPDELNQVLMNLCINAGHAMPDGGVLTIGLKQTGYIELTRNGDVLSGDFVDLSVSDTGTGIDDEIKAHIFDPFFTTKEIGIGSGLGLSVVHGIVEQHEGIITVESELGNGSTFHVYLPLESDHKIADEDPTINQVEATGSKHILLIDDEVMITDLTKVMLNSLGYQSTVVNDAREALKLFSKHPDQYDLIITDYGMPRINGQELITQARRIRQDIPIIMITGYGNTISGDNIIEWQLNGLVEKPFNISELSQSVEAALNKDS